MCLITCAFSELRADVVELLQPQGLPTDYSASSLITFDNAIFASVTVPSEDRSAVFRLDPVTNTATELVLPVAPRSDGRERPNDPQYKFSVNENTLTIFSTIQLPKPVRPRDLLVWKLQSGSDRPELFTVVEDTPPISGLLAATSTAFSVYWRYNSSYADVLTYGKDGLIDKADSVGACYETPCSFYSVLNDVMFRVRYELTDAVTRVGHCLLEKLNADSTEFKVIARRSLDNPTRTGSANCETYSTQLGNQLVFVTNDAFHSPNYADGFQQQKHCVVWTTDGTRQGTFELAHLVDRKCTAPRNRNGQASFLVTHASSTGNFGIVWRTDGTRDGTHATDEQLPPIHYLRRNTPIHDSGYGIRRQLVSDAQRLSYYNHRGVLWRTDETHAGTMRVLDEKNFEISSIDIGGALNSQLYGITNNYIDQKIVRLIPDDNFPNKPLSCDEDLSWSSNQSNDLLIWQDCPNAIPNGQWHIRFSADDDDRSVARVEGILEAQSSIVARTRKFESSDVLHKADNALTFIMRVDKLRYDEIHFSATPGESLCLDIQNNAHHPAGPRFWTQLGTTLRLEGRFPVDLSTGEPCKLSAGFTNHRKPRRPSSLVRIYRLAR